MHLDKLLLSIMACSKQDYLKLKDNPAILKLEEQTKTLIHGIDLYYKKYPVDNIDNTDRFKIQFFDLSKLAKQEDAPFYSQLINSSFKPIDGTTKDGVIRQLRELELSGRISELLISYERGDEVALYEDMAISVKEFESDLRRIQRESKVTKDIGEILQNMNTGHSYTWSLQPLALAMPHMRHGHQIIIGARPGIGKTSFMCHEAVRWAPKTPDERPIIYFNNESKGEFIWPSLYRTAFGLDDDQLQSYTSQQLKDAWNSSIGMDRIQIYDIHGFSIYDIEDILLKEKPAICIFDMVDNIKGFSDQARTDLRLEELYKWTREAAVMHDFLSIPISQTSVEAEGVNFPDKSMLKDSKTAKQGACDAIVMMGASNASTKQNARFFHVAKLMKAKPDAQCKDATGRCEVHFEANTCAFNKPMALKVFSRGQN